MDAKYFIWQKAQQKGRKEKLQRELKKLSAKLQEIFAKFFYKQKVVEEMIVVAGNVHEKFQASLRHIQELEAQRTTAERRGGDRGRTAPKSRRSNNSCGCRARSFTRRSAN